MSEPIEMSQARNVYVRERERFRRELVFTLGQYDSCPLSFEIKQHLRLRAADLKPECMEQYRRDTAKLSVGQPPVVGHSLRIRSMCPTDQPRAGSRETNAAPSLPRNRLTYECTRRATTNYHALAFERQLIQELDQMTDLIDQLTEANRHQWLRPDKHDRHRQYFTSRYDDTGYSLPLHHPVQPGTTTVGPWKYRHEQEQEPGQQTQVQQFYDRYLATSSFLNKDNQL